ncbi:MAG: HDOD domain-containing protein [Planctomyces sp.]|nr:HDOD domain-containing protein [Planctomyces sp.]
MSSTLERILSSDRLPSLPEIALRIVEIAKRPDPDFDELVSAIRMDPALAGRVLKTANSALLGMRSRATSIEAAVPRLGTTMVRALVLGFCLAEYQDRRSLNLRPWYQEIWRHSLTQAAAAEALADRQNGKVDVGNWFLAAMLQDIGRLAMLHTCGEEYVANVLDVDDDRLPIERELSYYGFSHVDVSVGLCKKWNLDSTIIDAIAMHHTSAHRIVPLRFVSASSLPAGLIAASQFADYLEEVPRNLAASRESLERLLIQVFAFRPSEIFRLLADVDSRMGELAATLSVDVGITTSRESILADAQELLSQIAITSQLRLINARGQVADAPKSSSAGKDSASSAPIDELKPWEDSLTRLFNRQFMDRSLAATLQQSQKTGIPMGIMLIDLDSFRLLNEREGQDRGDMVLRKTADVLRESVRISDSVVRYGADDFLVVLADINLDMLTLLGDEIRRRVSRDVILDSDEPDRQTCSLGGILVQPSANHPLTTQSILQSAEIALEEARRFGGNRSVIRIVDPGKLYQAEPGQSAESDHAQSRTSMKTGTST